MRLSKIFSTELAAAPELIIEAVFLDNLVSALLKAAFTPVFVPPYNLITAMISILTDHFTCPCSGLIDLIEGFPSR